MNVWQILLLLSFCLNRFFVNFALIFSSISFIVSHCAPEMHSANNLELFPRAFPVLAAILPVVVMKAILKLSVQPDI